MEVHCDRAGTFGLSERTRTGIPTWKRCLDFLILVFGLPAVLPMMLIIGGLIKLVSRGPVFFKQERIGYQGRPFTCLKFRTMHVGADAAVHQQHVQRLMNNNLPLTKLDLKGDRRLIPFGSLIRASGLDELPQLINVLRGDMSVVGPRPCVRFEYEHLLPWHHHRFQTPPGLTGLWQISRRGGTSFTKMIELDIEYVVKKSPWMDVSIIFQTVPAVFSQITESLAARRARSINSVATHHQNGSKNN
jgi:exopolysaccharide production protein ExoY